jgi:hypothetical protein
LVLPKLHACQHNYETFIKRKKHLRIQSYNCPNQEGSYYELWAREKIINYLHLCHTKKFQFVTPESFMIMRYRISPGLDCCNTPA